MNQKIIHSEQFYVSRDPDMEIVTILGSCVAVCLFDEKNSVFGMNHYLLPLWNGNGLKSLRFGNISTERLIEAMYKEGASLSNMKAKVFGGAQININEQFSVAPRNIQIAVDILNMYNIPIIAQDTGGEKGRKIFFQNVSGDVYIKYSR